MFHGQTANLNKLYHDGQAGDRSLILDIGKIPGFDSGFVIQNGVKVLIKRKRFEAFLDDLSAI